MKGKSAEDEKTNQKKTRKSAKNKRNMESAQTSIADIIDWESKRSTKGNTTVLYDSLPGKYCVAENNPNIVNFLL